MSAPTVRRDFRITLDGYTRYVGMDGKSADSTLVLPKPVRIGARISTEVMIGALPLHLVEFKPSFAEGDVITAEQAAGLPEDALLINAGQGRFRVLHMGLGR